MDPKIICDNDNVCSRSSELLYRMGNILLGNISIVCPRSFYLLFIVSYNIKCVTTSWTYNSTKYISVSELSAIFLRN